LLYSDQPGDAPATRLGRYELLGHLATGGMAEIHVARLAGEAGFEKIVVVKRLLPELVASKAYVAMFLDEAKLVSKLDHPNICEVHELGRDGNEYFLVMPYLDGVPATELIGRPRESDRLGQLAVAMGVVVQACAGLHHAHELRGPDKALLGLVHRDVSPSNLFVTTAGVVKLLDFGIAKVHGAAETEAGTIKGKTQYMAPEQLLGEPVDRRSDLFALGIVAFELATHQRLFKRASDYLAARAILEEPIPRADAVDPAVPAALADAIAKALSREPKERFADARELARAIEAAVPIASAERIAAALADEVGEQLTAQRTRQARVLATAGATDLVTVATKPRSRRGVIVAGGIVVAAAIAILVWLRPPGSASSIDTRAPLVAVSAPTDATVANDHADHVAPNGEPVVAVSAPNDAAVALGHEGDGAPSGDPIDAAAPEIEMPGDRASPHLPARPPGQFSVNSTPYATITVDGHALGITPMIHHAMAAGHHRLRAVLEDGRSQELTLDVPPGKAAAPIVLRW